MLSLFKSMNPDGVETDKYGKNKLTGRVKNGRQR